MVATTPKQSRPAKKQSRATDAVSLVGDVALPTAKAAAVLGRKPGTLRDWRLEEGKGPRWRKLGNGKQAPVLYLRSDLEQWLRSNITRIGGGDR